MIEKRTHYLFDMKNIDVPTIILEQLLNTVSQYGQSLHLPPINPRLSEVVFFLDINKPHVKDILSQHSYNQGNCFSYSYCEVNGLESGAVSAISRYIKHSVQPCNTVVMISRDPALLPCLSAIHQKGCIIHLIHTPDSPNYFKYNPIWASRCDLFNLLGVEPPSYVDAHFDHLSSASPLLDNPPVMNFSPMPRGKTHFIFDLISIDVSLAELERFLKQVNAFGKDHHLHSMNDENPDVTFYYSEKHKQSGVIDIVVMSHAN